MRMTSPAVRMDLHERVATLTIGDGSRRNALGNEGWASLAAGAVEVGQHLEVRAVVVRGAGGNFCAGSDLRSWREAQEEPVRETFRLMERALRAVEAIPVPVIALVEGAAAGGGLQLALACDLRVVGEDSRLGMPIARLGILPSAAFAGRLAQVAGAGVARELLYTGRLLSGAEAVERRLADRVVPHHDLDKTVVELVASIVRQPRTALVAAKTAVADALAGCRAPGLAATDTIVDESVFRPAVDAFLAHTLTC